MKRASSESSIRWLFMLGASTVLTVFAGFGIWSITTKISGAVIAIGILEPTIPSHIISHHKGGIVENVYVYDGKSVKRGEILVSLDSTQLDLEIDSVSNALADLEVLRLRAEAERSDEMKIEENIVFLSREMNSDLNLKGRIVSQNAVLSEKRERLERESISISLQMLEIEQQLSGLGDEIKATKDELDFIQKELEFHRTLFAKKLVARANVSELELNIIRTYRELGKLTSKVGQLETKKSELSLADLTAKDKVKEAAQSELDRLTPEITTKASLLTKLIQEKKYLVIRSPIDGRIHDLQVSGEGFVVKSGTPVAKVVSNVGKMQAIVRIGSNDIDQVLIGQSSNIRFQAFNARLVPLVMGEVASIAADVIVDPTTRRSYFEASIDIPKSELKKLGDRPIGNGMEVTAFLKTEDQTPFEYITRPIALYFNRALRDR